MSILTYTRASETAQITGGEGTPWTLHVWDHEYGPEPERVYLDAAITAQRLLADYRISSLVNAMLAAGSWCREPGGDWSPHDDVHVMLGSRMISVTVSFPPEDGAGFDLRRASAFAAGHSPSADDVIDEGRRTRVELLRACCDHLDTLIERALTMTSLL